MLFSLGNSSIFNTSACVCKLQIFARFKDCAAPIPNRRLKTKKVVFSSPLHFLTKGFKSFVNIQGLKIIRKVELKT